MVDRDVLVRRISALLGYIDDLRAFHGVSRDEFVAKASIHRLAERDVHLACEAMLDIAHHVISDSGWGAPDSYRESMRVLADRGVLPADLARRLEGWVGLRNILVHLYLDTDHGRVHDAIVSELGDLEAFARAIRPLL